MAARRKEKREVDVVANFIDRILPYADELGRTSCPRCGGRLLSMDISPNSGIKVSCDGYWAGDTEDGLCKWFIVEQLLVDKDLPVMPSLSTVQPMEIKNAPEPKRIHEVKDARIEEDAKINHQSIAESGPT